MRKILILLILLATICSLIFIILKDKFNINKILERIENNTGISIDLKNNQKFYYYPKISYQNSLSLYGNNGNLIIKNSNINITRDYRITSPILIKFKSPSILYKGINFRNATVESEYHNKAINLNNFSANIIDGKINGSGYLSKNKEKEIILKGSYDNISINRILKQLDISNWERVKIKISSSGFLLQSIYGSKNNIINNLNGEMDISGSIFFVSKEEERFGAAFLSLLADKFTSVKSLSQSINYLLERFADLPSKISGKININAGILTTKKMLIENQKEKALLTASLNLKTNKIKGKIDLYENDIIFLTAELKGNIENPEIYISGEAYKKEDGKEPKNIKEIFEGGIQSLIDNILNISD